MIALHLGYPPIKAQLLGRGGLTRDFEVGYPPPLGIDVPVAEWSTALWTPSPYDPLPPPPIRFGRRCFKLRGVVDGVAYYTDEPTDHHGDL